MKIFQVWYRTDDGMDFAECKAMSDVDAREWFRANFPYEYIVDVEQSDYEMLEG